MVVHQKSAQVVPRILVFFFSSRRRHTRLQGDWSSDVCSSDLDEVPGGHAVSFEREVFPKLVGGDLYGRLVDGYWIDIGTPEIGRASCRERGAEAVDAGAVERRQDEDGEGRNRRHNKRNKGIRR